MIFVLSLILLAVSSYVQNMAFTWSSRSRNSGDPSYHRYAAWASNGVWLVTNVQIFKQVWDVMDSGQWWRIILVALVYVIFTTEGSVQMMKVLIGRETGKRRVGG